jgi:hypothetical protein
MLEGSFAPTDEGATQRRKRRGTIAHERGGSQAEQVWRMLHQLYFFHLLSDRRDPTYVSEVRPVGDKVFRKSQPPRFGLFVVHVHLHRAETPVCMASKCSTCRVDKRDEYTVWFSKVRMVPLPRFSKAHGLALGCKRLSKNCGLKLRIKLL